MTRSRWSNLNQNQPLNDNEPEEPEVSFDGLGFAEAMEEASAPARSMAHNLRDCYVAFVNEGFTNEQAMELTQQAFWSMLNTASQHRPDSE